MEPKQTVLITGASSGIGLALAQAFHHEGFNVVANSRTITSSGQLQAGPSLLMVDGDVGLAATGAKLVEAAVRTFGRLDVLIQCGHLCPQAFRRVHGG